MSAYVHELIMRRAHLAVEFHPTRMERAKRYPRRSSGASHCLACSQDGKCARLAQLDFAARGASRSACATGRHGAGRLRSQDPFRDSGMPQNLRPVLKVYAAPITPSQRSPAYLRHRSTRSLSFCSRCSMILRCMMFVSGLKRGSDRLFVRRRDVRKWLT